MMTTDEAIRERLQALITEHCLSRSALSRKSGVPRSTINDLLDGRTTNIGIKNIAHLSWCFRMTLRDFFDADVFDVIDE